VDALAWHGLMGAVMLLTLLWNAPPAYDWLAAGLFVLAVLWSVLRTAIPRVAGHFARLCLMSGAMAAMLVPSGAAGAAPVALAEHPAGHLHPLQSVHPMQPMLLSGSGALIVALTMASVALATAWIVARPSPVRLRISACCEALMAGSMAVMAAALI
jgi:hypothetical protein